jgi:hypothetical protein
LWILHLCSMVDLILCKVCQDLWHGDLVVQMDSGTFTLDHCDWWRVLKILKTMRTLKTSVGDQKAKSVRRKSIGSCSNMHVHAWHAFVQRVKICQELESLARQWSQRGSKLEQMTRWGEAHHDSIVKLFRKWACMSCFLNKHESPCARGACMSLCFERWFKC